MLINSTPNSTVTHFFSFFFFFRKKKKTKDYPRHDC